MKVRLLSGLVSVTGERPVAYEPGDIYECSATEGKRLIELERAVAVGGSPGEVESAVITPDERAVRPSPRAKAASRKEN